MTQQLVDFALLGAEWVLFLLVGLSVLSVAIMVERGMFFYRRRIDHDALQKAAVRAVSEDTVNALIKKYKDHEAMAARVALERVLARRLDDLLVVPVLLDVAGRLHLGEVDVVQDLVVLGADLNSLFGMSDPAVLEWSAARPPSAGRPPRAALVALGAAFVTGMLVAKALEHLAKSEKTAVDRAVKIRDEFAAKAARQGATTSEPTSSDRSRTCSTS